MTTIDHELAAWLGPAAEQLTDEQTDRIAREADAIAARYPDPDDADRREEALSAAVQLLLGDTTPEQVRDWLVSARMDLRRANAAAQQIALMLDADHARYEREACRRTGVDKMTLRKLKGL